MDQKVELSDLTASLDEVYNTSKSEHSCVPSVYDKCFELIQFNSKTDNKSKFSVANDIVSQLQSLLSYEHFIKLSLFATVQHKAHADFRERRYKDYFSYYPARGSGAQGLIEDELELSYEPFMIRTAIMQAFENFLPKPREKSTQKTKSAIPQKKVQFQIPQHSEIKVQDAQAEQPSNNAKIHAMIQALEDLSPKLREKSTIKVRFQIPQHSDIKVQDAQAEQASDNASTDAMYIENKSLELKKLGKRLVDLANRWGAKDFIKYRHGDRNRFSADIAIFNFIDAVDEGSLDRLQSLISEYPTLIASASTEAVNHLKTLNRDDNPLRKDVHKGAVLCKKLFEKTPPCVYSQACVLIEQVQALDNLIWEKISEYLEAPEEEHAATHLKQPK
ncbi:MAG: hypothetical protein P1U61_06110 [Legionellaceae bacterium]|nr:hypothetical protein [Legionellaceae bacterium]